MVGGAEDPELWKLHTLGTQGADREVLELTVDQQVDCGYATGGGYIQGAKIERLDLCSMMPTSWVVPL